MIREGEGVAGDLNIQVQSWWLKKKDQLLSLGDGGRRPLDHDYVNSYLFLGTILDW